MKRKELGKIPPVIRTLVKAVANETENTHEPVCIYVGLEQLEKRYKVADLGGEPIFRTQKENNFSYRATDSFTRKAGLNFFFEAHEKGGKGEENPKDELEERAGMLRELLKDYEYVDTPHGVKIGLRPQRGKYVKMGALLCYVLDVDAGYEMLRGAQRRLPFS
jgi:hypothetical protein